MTDQGKALATTTAAVPAVMSDREIESSYRIAKALAASGFFKDAKQAEQAFAKLLFGRDLGLSPTQAMTSIHIVEGKPELSANLQAQKVKDYVGPDGERYDYRILTPQEQRATECEIEFRRREPGRDWEVIGTEKFSMADAQRAGLAGRNVWKSYPRNMLFARAISNGVAFHCPEVTGGLRVYAEGEIGGEEKPPEVEAAGEPEPPDVEVVEPEDANVVETVSADVAKDLFALTREAVDVGAVDSKKVRQLLISLGASRVDSLGNGIASLPPESEGAMRDFLAAATGEAAA